MLPNSDIFPRQQESGRFPAHVPETLEGFYLDELPVGAKLEAETAHHVYKIENRGDGKALIQGHPKYCPEPVLVDLIGSSSRGGMLKLRFLGPGFHMEFQHPKLGIISTSRVVNLHEVDPAETAH